MKCSVASLSMIDLEFCTFTGEYEPAVSRSMSLVPSSTLTYLNDKPFVLTLLPEGRLLLLRLLRTKVFPLSYKPTTATIAPSHLFERDMALFCSPLSVSNMLLFANPDDCFRCDISEFTSLSPITFSLYCSEEFSKKFLENFTAHPLFAMFVMRSMSTIKS